MTTVSIQKAQANLANLIHGMTPGDELVITENNQPVARLVPTAPAGAARQLGSMRGSVLYMAPDFDAPLDDFKEYMQ
jgi:prevent-host-death family protein